MSIRDEVVSLFVDNKDKKILKFYKYPCFACQHVGVETDGEYGEYSWATCNKSYDDNILELFVERKQDFPNCEAPKKCIRNRWFLGGIRYGRYDVFDGIGYGLWHDLDVANGYHLENPSIAGGIVAFHKRMTQIHI